MQVVSVLAASPVEDDTLLLEHIFSHSNWKFGRVQSCREAVEQVGAAEVPVVISAVDLGDGTWKDLLNAFQRQPIPPRLIVVSHAADDRLWADVLELGGYDVLGKPFDAREVIRVVSLAWRQWKHDCERAGRAFTQR